MNSRQKPFCHRIYLLEYFWTRFILNDSWKLEKSFSHHRLSKKLHQTTVKRRLLAPRHCALWIFFLAQFCCGRLAWKKSTIEHNGVKEKMDFFLELDNFSKGNSEGMFLSIFKLSIEICLIQISIDKLLLLLLLLLLLNLIN